MHYFLMAIGAVFSIAGLVLIFRRTKTDTGAAKVEFLGQKLEANSTGIVVFLIGAAFLAAPLFVPMREPIQSSTTAPAASSNSSAPNSPAKDGNTVSASGSATDEVEDNNSFAKANIVLNGATTGGYLNNKDEDWFVVDVGSGIEKILKVTLRFTGDGCADFALFDASESLIGSGLGCGSNGVKTKTFAVPQGKIHLRITAAHTSGNFTLTAASN